MSKQWYFQVMGAEVGPLSPMELADKVKRSQIQADTLVRKGADGKWMPADRIKGLLAPPDSEPPLAAKAPTTTTTTKSDATEPSQPAVATPDTHSLTVENESTYHLDGDKAAAVAASAQQATEFDFFQFVGFRQAITSPLHEALESYARQHQLTFTQITRRALAQFLGRPELGEDKPVDAEAESL